MKRKPMQGLMAAALLVSSLWTGTPAFANSVGEEIKIDASQPEISEDGFDISKDYAVWKVEGEKTLTLYNLSKQTELKIGDKKSDKTSPRVDGKYVVWIDSRNGGSDVYLYDIAKDEEIRLTKDASVSGLEITGKQVAWADKSDEGTDIYLYNISTGDTTRVSTSGKAESPTVGDSYVAWADKREGNYDIYYYDIERGVEKAAVSGKGDQIEPSIYSDKIVYENSTSQQIYQYSISGGKNKQLTDSSDSKGFVHIFKDRVVYLEDDDLVYHQLNKTFGKEIVSNIFDEVGPRLYEDYVLYAKKDNNKKLRLSLYDLDEQEVIPLGTTSGKPIQPDASDRYVVYVAEAKKGNAVILYDTEKGTSKTISSEDSDPERAVVSGRYVVWYDQKEDALVAYDIRKGTTKQITDEDEDQEPSDKLYEVDGDNLFWVNINRRADLMITDLATEKTTEIESLKSEPLSIDIYGNYAAWVAETGKKTASVYLYEIDEQDTTEIRKNVNVQSAQIGDDFVVWSETSDKSKTGWDLYRYNMDRQRTDLLMRFNDRDQKNPQASRNMVLFEDNRLTKKDNDFYYELYDAEDGSFSDVEWNEKAEMSSARIGGNRVVWIDERDGDPVVYTMAFAKPQDSDEEEEPGEEKPEPGEVKEFKYVDLLNNNTLGKLLKEVGYNNFVYVFFEGTDEEVTMTMREVVNDKRRFDNYMKQSDVDEVVVRVTY
ncbi:hypothetical protein KM924_04325 [Brevibacillus parabrevis]|jgi:beta propeller repeat protein|uniref:hypothetical protein n=1 Tax=Brevibacillus parabrevis TaxID=54914 RepID=UPI001C234097|nr:hypothetical protein [Brevibacillus parabrevis]MBU8711724.1 hypothetical protein [Brevibacillus parabrevis]